MLVVLQFHVQSDRTIYVEGAQAWKPILALPLYVLGRDWTVVEGVCSMQRLPEHQASKLRPEILTPTPLTTIRPLQSQRLCSTLCLRLSPFCDS